MQNLWVRDIECIGLNGEFHPHTDDNQGESENEITQ